MSKHQETKIIQRKQPRQARSADVVAAILEAAARVLATEGAQRFTTARVAERAGVSIGSLYQYFPNKAAILFRLQCEEWRQTTSLLQTILQDAGMPPLDRLRTLVHAFVTSECEEAAMRAALHDSAPLYRHAPETAEIKAESRQVFSDFVAEALPLATESQRALVAELTFVTLAAAGKHFSSQGRSPQENEACATAVADMLCAYFSAIAQGPLACPQAGDGPYTVSAI